MFRCLMVVLSLVVFFAGFSSTAYSEFRFTDGSKIEIQWYEQAGTIRNGDVCFNYKDDNRKYKQCRKKAVKYFKEECAFYTDKVRNSPRKYRDMYIPEQEKFCNAHEAYEP